METIFNKHKYLILPLRTGLMTSRASLYASKIRTTGAMLPHCVGYIDVTKIHICRSGGHSSLQQAVYSGHKRIHCLLFCTVTSPDGLIFYCEGPVEGRRHDLFLLNFTGLDDDLRSGLLIDGTQYYVHGDSAYVNHVRAWILCGFPRAYETPFTAAFNRSKNRSRTSVEWSYKDLKQMFTSLDFKTALKIRKIPVGIVYTVSCMLWNVKNCLHGGGQVGTYFDCQLPSLEQYLNSTNSSSYKLNSSAVDCFLKNIDSRFNLRILNLRDSVGVCVGPASSLHVCRWCSVLQRIGLLAN